jgi:hypothetical protein
MIANSAVAAVSDRRRRSEIDATIYVAQYNKEDIRANRNNVAERLGFLCRIVHGVDARGWVKELRAKLGEATKAVEAIQT